jgi:hypothetical protein
MDTGSKASTFSAKGSKTMDTVSYRRALLAKKGPKLWIQVVRRALLAQKRSKTLNTGSKSHTFSAKRVQNYGYR